MSIILQVVQYGPTMIQQKRINYIKTWHSRLLENGNFDVESEDLNPWLPVTDEFKEDEWVNIHTREPITYSDWMPGQPNGDKSQNCVAVRLGHEKTELLQQWWWDECCSCRTVSL